jgi:hypothetical protein
VPSPLTLIRRDWTLFFVGFRSWRKRACWAWHKLNAAPSAIRIVVIAATALAVFPATNLVYQVVRKPTEMFFPVSGAMNKIPGRDLAAICAALSRVFHGRHHARATRCPGAPGSKNLLAVAPDLESFRDLSTRLERRRHVPDDRRSLRRSTTILHPPPHCRGGRLLVQLLYTRVVPSHAIELTAVFLDRKVAAILARPPNATATLQQKQDLAAMIHLCGAGPAKAFARRGFRLIAGERCGEHDVATYVAQVNAMKREFLRIGAET